jgi:preprotein translocase subunit YajC
VATILALQAQGAGPGIGFIVQMVAIVAIFYFIVILPQRREQKRHREMIATLRAGDEVVTFGGLVGEVVQIKEDLITVKTGDSRVVVERARIQRLLRSPSAPAAKA